MRAWKDLQNGKLQRVPVKQVYKMDAYQKEFDKVLNMQTKETSHRQLLAWYNAMKETQDVCLSEFQRMIGRSGVVKKKRQATSRLMGVHEIERMVWTAEQVPKTGIWIHIDEKNFKAIEIGKGHCYVSNRMTKKKIAELTTKAVQSKRNISWVMFQAAVGQPMPWINFNGKLMLRRICVQHKAKKPSVKHQKGDRYDKHANYNGEMHLKLIDELCEAITVQFKGLLPEGTVVNVQMDGAGPHAGEAIERAAERRGRRNIPRVVFHRQIAQSCIFNFLDLSLFNHLGAAAARKDYGTVEQLVKGVWEAWEKLTPTMIERVVALQKVVLVETFNSRGSYITVPSIGLRQAQAAGKLDDFLAEFIATQMRKY
jgi:hypothetical protein